MYRVICSDCKYVLAKTRDYNIPILPDIFDANKGQCPECGKKLVMDLPIIIRK